MSFVNGTRTVFNAAIKTQAYFVVQNWQSHLCKKSKSFLTVNTKKIADPTTIVSSTQKGTRKVGQFQNTNAMNIALKRPMVLSASVCRLPVNAPVL